MRMIEIKYTERKTGKWMDEEFERKEQYKVLHEIGKFLKVNK
jgi:hypothetical protein